MSWLTPERIDSNSYNPYRKVEAFVTSYGPLAKIALKAWNEVDPLQCYYGDGCNPDEYVDYAERFIDGLVRVFEDRTDPAIVEELVRRSFHAKQVIPLSRLSGNSWVSMDAIKEIAQAILRESEAAGLKLESYIKPS